MAITNRTDVGVPTLHGDFKVTPMTLSSGVRVALPTTTLRSRKTFYVWNDGTSSQTLYIGNHSVSEFSTTTSGLPIIGQSGFGIDVGRATVYGITTVSGLSIKVCEAA